MCAAPASARAGRRDASARRRARAGEGLVVLYAPLPRRVLIRGGVFRMGSDIPAVTVAQASCRRELLGRECKSTAFADEMVAHDVMVRDFWLDVTEVTRAAFARCAAAGACRRPGWASSARQGEGQLPATLVSWYQAATYCRWAGGQLATEAQWERAARGWRSRTYPWGEVFNPRICNHGRFSANPLADDDGHLTLAPVASYPQGRTAEGVADLAGNAEEWVADWYAPGYAQADEVDPRGPASGDTKVVRGGSYRSGRAWLRGAARGQDLPSSRRAWRGFRCAYEPAAHTAGGRP